MRLNLVFLAIIFSISMQSCSQTNKVVRKSIAYRSVRNAGTIAVDDNGNPISSGIDTAFVVYVETGSRKMVWESAEYNGNKYSIAPVIAAERPVIVGINKKTGEQLKFIPDAGNTVWKLELLSGQPIGIATQKGVILLKGKYGNSAFLYTIKKLTEVQLPDAY